MAFCLPQEFQNKFMQALRSGQIDPAKLMDMTSAERNDFFSKIVGEENAKDVNAQFESKLLLQDQKRGLVTWAKKMTGLSDRARADFVDKISKLDRVLQPDEEKRFLADLAEQKLGVSVSVDEAKQIADLAQKAQVAKAQPTTNMSGVSDEYLKAADQLRQYIASRKPTTALASIGKNAAAIGRDFMLMNPSTPLKTSISQFFNSALDVFTRRIASLRATGAAGDLASKANTEAWQTFKKTGLNTASMENLDDTGKLGEGTRFNLQNGVDKSSAPVRAIETGVRKVAQVTNKIAIDWEHNISYTKFYQKAFFDSANILASHMGKDAADARAIFTDAARIEPQTDVGALVRNQAQLQAARVTSTNPTVMSNFALAVKDALNGNRKVFGAKLGRPGLGDAIVPIAKIPANIIANGIENAGVGIPTGIYDMVKGRMKMGADDILTKQQGLAQFAQGFQRLSRTVGVLSLSAYIASNLTRQDFKTDNYGASYVKIGGTWVNMEYVSAISPALAGMMFAKKDSKPGQSPVDTAGQYVAGTSQGLKNLPAVGDINQAVTSLTNPTISKGVGKYLANFINSRGYPAFIKQLNSPTPIKGLFFSTTGLPTQAELKKLGAK